MLSEAFFLFATNVLLGLDMVPGDAPQEEAERGWEGE